MFLFYVISYVWNECFFPIASCKSFPFVENISYRFQTSLKERENASVIFSSLKMLCHNLLEKCYYNSIFWALPNVIRKCYWNSERQCNVWEEYFWSSLGRGNITVMSVCIINSLVFPCLSTLHDSVQALVADLAPTYIHYLFYSLSSFSTSLSAIWYRGWPQLLWYMTVWWYYCSLHMEDQNS